MRRRVLVVEDDEKSRRLLADVLTFHGYEVMAAASGEGGLREAHEWPPDAALLDIQLPGISGFDVLDALRSTGLRIPVIAVTASVMEHDRRRVLEAGFDAFIAKPVNIGELTETLRRLLEAQAP